MNHVVAQGSPGSPVRCVQENPAAVLELLREWLDHPELLRTYESNSLHDLRERTRRVLEKATDPGVTG